ncbi:MAG TPA: DUF4440 domain-containing protein [Rhizomicrobium sp.]|jgi:uncharacterized protein (TIGR02246 family)
MIPRIAFLVLLAASAAGAAPENVSQQWAGYWNAKNLKAILTLYAPQPVFLPASGGRWEGAGSIRTHFAQALKQYDPRLTMQSVVSSTSGTLAYDSGTYDEILAPAKGGRQVHVHGSYLFLFQKQRRGGWKILEQSWTEYDPAKL